MMSFDKKQVLDFLPHRDPMLFVDSIESLTPPKDKNKDFIGAVAIGKFCPHKSHPIFAGHFPGNPIFPGVLQVECMGQVSSFITAMWSDIEFSDMNLDVALVGVDKCRFRKPILPEMDLTIKSEFIRKRSIYTSYRAQIYNGEDLMSEAEFLATVIVKKKVKNHE